ncbi:hypothetical protein PRIPAC_97222 [Pristionchus pacificus]|uniref:Uncharacterized protein n=1 Tax=Pristionchus pacificus TaxID=54126 RepID=A0A2A6D0Q5_PRIPA|nr:hypothetical protein PRIPAC_97222 [Pristionchus pacificus]|eukprot:PDM83969.1 hypothetical protein PRIPAC_34161 [Pristionchus pacificus]
MHLSSSLLLVILVIGTLLAPTDAYSGMAKLPSDDHYRRRIRPLAPIPPPRPAVYYYRPALNPFFPQLRRMAFSNRY